ncbi:MAG: SHOCT domain-containing protein [Candidatus Saccharimonas sp.]
MPFGHRSARRRGVLVGAAIGSSRAKKQAATAQNTTPPATQAPADNTIEQIKQLAALRDQGILTEEEFSSKKKQILGI